MNFELTNAERKYLGLCLVGTNWEFVKYNENTSVYYENNIIRKHIFTQGSNYCESELSFETAENRTVLLPKTQRGKPRKVTPSAIANLNPYRTYFHYQNGDILIGNYTNQRTYYSTQPEKKYASYEELRNWLNLWVKESSENDLKDIGEFSNAKAMHCKYRQGDFFRFKIGRRKYGFGRILLDANKVRKADNKESPLHYGFSILIGKPLIVKIYHMISDVKDVDFNILKNLKALPSQYIMDNIFYYGECEVIGNMPLSDSDPDFPMQYGRSISLGKEDDICFQWGLTAKHAKVNEMEQFIHNRKTKLESVNSFFSYSAMSWSLRYTVDVLSACISEKSNRPYWESNFSYVIEKDLRNPKYNEQRSDVMDFFGIQRS
jgi:hypothetical protein